MIDPALLYLTGALLLAGAAAGFTAGLFGVGGGAIMVPVLFYVLEALGYPASVTMHMAVATSSAVIIVSSLRSTLAHHRHGAVDWSILWPKPLWKSWGLWIGAGALLGAGVLAKFFSGPALTVLFGLGMALLSLQFIFGRPDFRVRENLPGGAALPLVGGSVGALSALLGIGGGSIAVSLLVLCGVKVHRAIGTAAGVGMFIAFPAAIGFIYSGWGAAGRPPFSLGYVSFLGFALIATTSLLFIPLGARIAHSTDQKRLRAAFGVFLLLVSLNMARKTLF